MLYYEAVKYGFHEMNNARDRYINACSVVGKPLNKQLILRYLEIHAVITSPITSHFSEYTWREALGKQGSVMHARWPTMGPVDDTLLARKDYIDRLLRESRLAMFATQKPPKKGKAPPAPVAPPKEVKVFVASAFPDWQEAVIALVKEVVEKVGRSGSVAMAMPLNVQLNSSLYS